MCAKNNTHTQQPVLALLRASELRRQRNTKKNGRKVRAVTSQTKLCDLILWCSVLQAGASAGQRGEEEGRRPLQAQSRTASAAQKDTGTHPSCRKEKLSDYIIPVVCVNVFGTCSLGHAGISLTESYNALLCEVPGIFLFL